MIGPVRGLGRRFAARHARLRSAYTLIEILVSTALTLMLLMAVVQIFGSVSDSIANSRAALEMTDQLRAAQMTLQRDLEGVTVTMSPPRRPESGEGYFEYTEGPIGPVVGLEYQYDLSDPDNFFPFMDYARNRDVTRTTTNADPVGYEIDTTVGDTDDMLLFTTRTRSTPFVGRLNNNPVESQEAEVAWFLRGRTLYRRVLLILPNAPVSPAAGAGFFGAYDISVRNNDAGNALAANSLSDLTKPENRFAHRASHKVGPSSRESRLPFHPHFNVDFTASVPIKRSIWSKLGMPTLRECSAGNWVAGSRLNVFDLSDLQLDKDTVFDAWLNPHPSPVQDPDTGALNAYLGPRIGEDVVLTNVIGFDVKAWDPDAPVVRVGPPVSSQPYTLLPGDRGYIRMLRQALNGAPGVDKVSQGAYVDLNYLCHLRNPKLPDTVPSTNLPTAFSGLGNLQSRVVGTDPFTSASSERDPEQLRSSVYDTWSTHYECDGVDTDGDSLVDEGTDGFDNNGDGVVDDAGELEAPPPYAAPLRGIQVRIRVFEPASRQIREVTVVQDFLPK